MPMIEQPLRNGRQAPSGMIEVTATGGGRVHGSTYVTPKPPKAGFVRYIRFTGQAEMAPAGTGDVSPHECSMRPSTVLGQVARVGRTNVHDSVDPHRTQAPHRDRATKEKN